MIITDSNSQSKEDSRNDCFPSDGKDVLNVDNKSSSNKKRRMTYQMKPKNWRLALLQM